MTNVKQGCGCDEGMGGSEDEEEKVNCYSCVQVFDIFLNEGALIKTFST